MMLSVLLWLAMQGQAQAANSQIGPITCNYCGQPIPLGNCTLEENLVNCDGHVIAPSMALNPPAPAEHVIEIKTRREHEQPVFTEKGFPAVRKSACDPNDVSKILIEIREQGTPNEERTYQCVCNHVTRELWIDGVKWGIVKGLE